MPTSPSHPTRREVLQSTGAGVLAASLAPLAGATFHPHGTDELKVGLIGCGGRGSGAATNALRADPQTRLYAMGDAFSDMLENSHRGLKGSDVGERVDVPPERRFTGFDAYQKVIEACDVILLATSPHFRPMHLAAAVAANRHVFVEKPVATDATGLRSIAQTCEQAKEKGLSIVSGLCYRYQFAKKETIQRIHDGAIGDPVALQCTYNTGGLWHRGRQPEWSEMEYQMRNWLYFTWLSGDHIAEQHIHSLDKLAWAMGDVYPESCVASGGRIVRTDPKWGNIFDHFNTAYQWPNGVRGFSSCRQWIGADNDVSDFVYGTKGVAEIQRHRIQSDTPWRYRGDGPDDMYQNEHDAFFASIRQGKPIHNGTYMVNSTMMAIMARMSAYTGKRVTWEQAWSSQEDLSPPAYAWGDVPQRPVAQPGITELS